MSPASIDDLKKELQQLPSKKVLELTLKLARFKKENKELLSYLLFEAGDEHGYVETLQQEIDEMLAQVKKGPSAMVKKQLRSITRLISRQSRYIGTKTAAAELHFHFCTSLLSHPDELTKITSANTIFHQQLNKLQKLLPFLNEDLQYDLGRKLTELRETTTPGQLIRRWWRGRRP